MIIVFIALILTKKLSPFMALVIVPIVFAAGAGLSGAFGFTANDTFTFAFQGIQDIVLPFTLLAFAILFFGIMIYAGLFDPLANLIVRFAKGDPLRLMVGSAALILLVSLDGDGTTSFMICCGALLPVFIKLKIPKSYLAAILVLGNGIVNLVPWGGPTGRIMSVLKTDTFDLLMALVPNIITSTILLFATAVFWGLRERKRLGVANIEIAAAEVAVTPEEAGLRRPGRRIANLILTLLVIVGVFLRFSAPVVFAAGVCLALLINYPKIKEGSKVIELNAPAVLNVTLMVLGAGVLLGILTYSGMNEAIASGLGTLIPQSMSGFFGIIIGIISAPGLFILNNDAFYFGVLPLLAETAQNFGFTPLQTGVASLMGQSARALSPLIPALYLMMSLLKLDFGEYQKRVAPIAALNFVVYLITCLAFGTIPIL
jgi:CitMHS family citrate-Mg2+:H+ or citrate-Ca2+:H+ symporter